MKEEKKQEWSAESTLERDRKPAPKKPKFEPKTILVYAIFVLIFLIVVWFILRPQGEESKSESLNTSLPSSADIEINDDKIALYQEDELSRRNAAQDSLLQAQFGMEDPTPGGISTELSVPTSIYDDEYGLDYRPVEVEQHSDEWYDREEKLYNLEDENAYLRSELAGMEKQVNTLQAELSASPTQEETLEAYKRKKEIDYQLADRYEAAGREVDPSMTHPDVSSVSVVPVSRSVVSTLEAPVSDSVLIARYSRVRNLGFNSAENNNNGLPAVKNAIRAVVDHTVVLKPGDFISLRLSEEISVGGVVLPRGTLLTGVARLSENRMKIIVSSIEYKDRIFGIGLTAFDVDGQEGIYVPLSDETAALREAASMVASAPMAGGVNFNNASAGDQILTDLARSVVRGGAGYLTKKITDVKITVKAGHRLFLVANNQTH